MLDYKWYLYAVEMENVWGNKVESVGLEYHKSIVSRVGYHSDQARMREVTR
jgi:hypothetical protein